MIDLEYEIRSFMILYILLLKHTICHRFRIQNDIFHILLPKQISSLGTVSGRFWGPRGVQIPLTLELKDNGRWRPRVPDELFGTLLPADRANFGGSPRAQSHMVSTDLIDTAVSNWRSGDVAASRSDPTFTRASQGLRQ